VIYLIPHAVEQAAARRPAQEAFRCYDQGLTYAALWARANALAHTLIDQGLRRGDRVGIYLHKSLECAVAIYGILQAGAAYVPLDPHAPPARVAFMVRDCGIRVIVSEESKRRALAALGAAEGEHAAGLACAIGLRPAGADGDGGLRLVSWADVASHPTTPPPVRAMQDDLAYVMYTSGSTGTPKGMMHTHASGLAYAKMAAQVYGVGPQDRLSNHSPLHFDMSTFDYFSGPLGGATTVVIPEEYKLLPASLAKLVEDERLTIWYSVPFALTQMLLRGELADRDMSALRWVLFGGEPFGPKHLHALMAQWPHARFSNVYGPAEVNQCTYFHVPPVPNAYAEEQAPIGKVWENAAGLIVDEDDRVLAAAPGVGGDEAPAAEPQAVEPQEAAGPVGELLIRAPTMMRGYWNRPDLTARALYTVAGEGGFDAVYYRTGDLVELLPDGNLRFLGRKDRQVKTRGYRVELDEVEAALLTHTGVEEAAVFAVPDAEGSRRIVAAVILKSQAAAGEAELARHLGQRLPPYAVPRPILVCATFPRTATGKIDRNALAAAAGGAAGGAGTGPAGAAERGEMVNATVSTVTNAAAGAGTGKPGNDMGEA
jgi:acyl-CoA synthetase (AMP-forming)/AMP-acid ligase II